MRSAELAAFLEGPEPALEARLEEALARPAGIEDLKEALAACSVLLHAAAARGELALPEIGRALRALESLKAPAAGAAVVGLGDAGREVLARLAPGAASGGPRGLLIDLETARLRAGGAGIPALVLEAPSLGEDPGIHGHGDLLRAAYRDASRDGPPPLLVETLLEAGSERVTVHVIAGLEEAWVATLPELLLDMRALLGHARGRFYLHLVTRPGPRARPGLRAALEDVERTRPVDEAFVVCASEAVLAERTAAFVRLAGSAPEVLLGPREAARRGLIGSYGVASLRLSGAETREAYLAALDDALAGAAPGWVPWQASLPEVLRETVYLVYPPEAPPREEAWRLCPELVPVPLPGAEPAVCRVQRGARVGEMGW